MAAEILYQILLLVGIIAGLLLIINLWRLYQILGQTKEITTIVNSRLKSLNERLAEAENFLSGLTQMLKTFVTSFEAMRKIKDKISEYQNQDKKKKGEKDEE